MSELTFRSLSGDKRLESQSGVEVPRSKTNQEERVVTVASVLSDVRKGTVDTLKHRRAEQIVQRNLLVFFSVFVFTAFITIPLLISVHREIQSTKKHLAIAANPFETLSLEEEYYLRKNFLLQQRKIESYLDKQKFNKINDETTAQFVHRVVAKLKKEDGLVFDHNTIEVVANYLMKYLLKDRLEKESKDRLDEVCSVDDQYSLDERWLMHLTEIRLSDLPLDRDYVLHRSALNLSEEALSKGSSLIQDAKEKRSALIQDAKDKWMARQYGNFVEFIHQSLGVGDSPGRKSFEREMRTNFPNSSYWNAVLEGRVERRFEADLHGQWYPK